ncbi:glycosyltransferase family 2 protein [Jannaschia sp. W003]|uniref:glycosyltransferase family 2 protein n=1 Tax=Jannaschia sp. W003 TaxID=2867012 RepID=UPI0021A87BFC|nr:glycosyltransferase family 2 protein [Jannaschia sp. W003]UWQ21585.1 glycosyltransferase [Jannaschia sp. W003]
MSAPEIAVIVAAWNAEATIGGAVRSALAQTGPAVEVIAVDDASTDGTAAVLETMAAHDPRLRVLRQPRNAGPAAARNRALAASTAPWVTVLDADDAMAPDRLARLHALAGAGGWDFVADDLFKVESHAPGSPRRRLWRDDVIGVVPLDFAAFVAGNLSRATAHRGELGFLKPLIRRAVLDRHGLRYREDMRLGEDFALYAAAMAFGARACLTDPCGYVALVRPASLSGRHDAAALGGLARASRWLATLPGLDAEARAVLRAHDRETQERWRWMRLIEAVRARDPRAGLACFAAHPRVSAALAGRLAEQVRLRGARRLHALTGRGGAAAADRGA